MKKVITLISLVVILVASCVAMNWTSIPENSPISYDGSYLDVKQLYDNPISKDEYNGNPDGVASIIVETEPEEAQTVNAVASIVFDYRGFDTIGESFIQLASIAGAHCILRSGKKKKEVAGK